MINLYAVTVKLPKRDDHDPRNKVTGPCPVNGNTCTDVTGEHHTILVRSTSIEQIKESMSKTHITRIEQVHV